MSERKKYYYKKAKRNYGKYYTYSRVRNIMSTYFRAKISVTLNSVWNQGAVAYSYVFNNQLLAEDCVSLAGLIRSARSWEGYRALFGYYKCRGILFEAEPNFQNVNYFNTNLNQVIKPYEGSVAAGLNNSNVGILYDLLVDTNRYVSLSTMSKTRVYWPFLVKDFTQVPSTAAIPVNGIPYYLVIARSAAPAGGASLPNWTIRVTFYMTFRQSNI